MNLADVLLERETGSGAVLRDGIVAAISPLTVIVPPSTVASPAAKLDSCNVRVGDFVQVLVQGANRVVIGVVGGGWQTYTPTIAYGTAATGTHDSRWRRHDRTIDVQIGFKITTGGTPGNLTATRPIAGRYGTLSFGYAVPLGHCTYAPAAGGLYIGVVTPALSNGTDVTFRTLGSPSAQWTHTVPVGIAANDEIYATFSYEVL